MIARNRDDAEVVYMKILEILLECLRCPAGEHLTNDIVCNMVTECFDVTSTLTYHHYHPSYDMMSLM
jgi:hypothetical protein